MSFEQALIAATGAMTTALLYVCRLLWSDMLECKRDRAEMHKTLMSQNGELGEVKGMIMAFRSCPNQNCPFPSPERHPLTQVIRPGEADKRAQG